MRKPSWRLGTVTKQPFNAETDPAALSEAITPTEALFERNHFDAPQIADDEWELRIKGIKGDESYVDLPMLQKLPQTDVTMVLECAGNGRSAMFPRPPGTAWGTLAVGCVTFRGPALRSVIPAKAIGTAKELVFTGGDNTLEGKRKRGYQRSLPLSKALDPNTILALSLNGEPLPASHGGPVRLVVPGWYGMAGVKWLVSVAATRKPYVGHFQTDHYVYWENRDGSKDRPVTRVLPKSIIVAPKPGPTTDRFVDTWGWAWSGSGIDFVEASGDAGRTWTPATLGPENGPYAWRKWTARVPVEGEPRELIVRATDQEGATQPLEAPWNRLGYGNNVAPRVRL